MVPSFPPIDVTGLSPYAAAKVLTIDATARTMAAEIIRTNPTPAELRARAAGLVSDWLAAVNLELAFQIERDARMAAASSIAASCAARGQTTYWADFYADLVREACGLPTVIDRGVLHPAAPAALSELRAA